nr:hypothetical protein Iba_chr13aCG10020 [Ipomoea batatas]
MRPDATDALQICCLSTSPPTLFSSNLLPVDANAAHRLCREHLCRRPRHSLQICCLSTPTPLTAYVVNSFAAADAILFRSAANCRTSTLLTVIAVVSTAADAAPPHCPMVDLIENEYLEILGCAQIVVVGPLYNLIALEIPVEILYCQNFGDLSPPLDCSKKIRDDSLRLRVIFSSGGIVLCMPPFSSTSSLHQSFKNRSRQSVDNSSLTANDPYIGTNSHSTQEQTNVVEQGHSLQDDHVEEAYVVHIPVAEQSTQPIRSNRIRQAPGHLQDYCTIVRQF